MSTKPAENFPKIIDDLSRSIVIANRELLGLSLERVKSESPFYNDFYFVGPLEFKLKMKAAKSQSGKIFWISTSGKPDKILTNIDVTLSTHPVPLENNVESTPLIGISYLIPPCMNTRLSPDEISQHTGVSKEIKANRSNTILLRMGSAKYKGLAFSRIGNGKKIKQALWFSNSKGKAQLIQKNQGTWPLTPFIHLTDILGEWMRGSLGEGEEVFGQLTQKVDFKDVTSIIEKIRDAYQVGAKNLAATKATDSPLLTSHGIDEFNADVTLRLNPDGRIAYENDLDSFQLKMSLKYVEGKTGPYLRISTQIPDFLVQGRFQRLFLIFMREDKALEKLSKELAKTKLGKRLINKNNFPDKKALKFFLRKPSENSLIFRTKRKEKSENRFKDTDILILRGDLPDTDRLLILEAKYFSEPNVPLSPAAPPELDISSIKVLHFGPTNTTGGTLDNKTAEYFFKLLRGLQNWVKIFK